MKTLILQIPETVDEKEVKLQLAAQLFEKGILSSVRLLYWLGSRKGNSSRKWGIMV
jgi:hypothetical protein